MTNAPTLIDWVAKVGPGRGKLAGFSIAKYGAQAGNDWQWFADAGNGIRTNGQFVTGNDPNDANVPSTVQFQQGWVQHLVSRWGTNAAGGVRYYVLDNEKVPVEHSEEELARVKETVATIADGILEQHFEPKPSPELCSFCDYRIICPAAEK